MFVLMLMVKEVSGVKGLLKFDGFFSLKFHI